MKQLALAIGLLAGLLAGVGQAQRPERELRRVLQQTWIHGITEADARGFASEADADTLLRLLADPDFERPDNAAAFLVHLAGEEAMPALDSLVQQQGDEDRSPEADRARLLLPRILGGVAERSGGAGLSALIELVAEEGLPTELGDLAASELGRLGLPGFAEPPRFVEVPRPALADPLPIVHGVPLDFANHVDLADPLEPGRLDLALSLANQRVGRADFEQDVSCCVQVERAGAARAFGTPGDGLDIIDDAADFAAVRTEGTARVKVVRMIRHCFGNDAPNIGGCAEISGDSMIVVRFGSATIEGLVWFHEYGHNTGIAQHDPDDRFLMSAITGFQDVAVSAGQCAKFHQPEPGTAINLLDRGACQDLDGDEVQDGIDNCPGAPNTAQTDQDFDGAGDACDEDDDGDGVPDGEDLCPGLPDGDDADGDGLPSCLDGCPEDPRKSEPGECGCGIVDVDADGDGVVNCRDGCPLDGDKLVPGACGCGLPDDDADGDATADCLDGCPLDAEKTEPGACGCGRSDLDSDADGSADCVDGCPQDAEKTAPGACGCGESETDADGDGTADCLDACPEDPGKSAAGDCGCGNAELDADGDLTADCLQCAFGDAWPPEGDGEVGLADWLALRRRISTAGPGSLRCLDLAPVARSCASGAACPAGGDGLDAADAALVRALASGLRELDCSLCEETAGPGAEARLAGDVSPPGGFGAMPAEVGDGRVDVSDVLQLLRWAVGVDGPPGDEEVLRGDLAPLEGGAVAGDGAIDVTDVLLTLRAVVGLAVLPWPVRVHSVELEPDEAIVAALVRLEGLPAWVVPVTDDAAACALGGEGGVEAADETVVIACAWDPGEIQGRLTAAAFAYRSPEPLPLEGPDSPAVEAEAIDGALDSVELLARLLAAD